jgi:hypothetical protein
LIIKNKKARVYIYSNYNTEKSKKVSKKVSKERNKQENKSKSKKIK